jgi:hypothetical protein
MDGWHRYARTSSHTSMPLTQGVQDVRDYVVPCATDLEEDLAEHHVFYQYMLRNAKNHYMGLIQTETVRRSLLR